MEGEPTPELFVARDRARRFARRIRDALQERRLAYKGAAVGMETLVDRADRDLASVIEDIDTTVADVDAGRIRDRERGYMEVPLLVMAEGVRERVARARRLEKARVARQADDKRTQRAVLSLLDDALKRIDAFCAAYDAKQPVGPVAGTDLARILERVETDRQAEHPPSPGSEPRPFDRAPPQIRTDGFVVEDLLRAVRAAANQADDGWHVDPAVPGRPLRLRIGDPKDLVRADLPDRVDRAVRLLDHLHPVEVRCLAERTDAADGDEGGLLSEPPDPDARIRAAVVLIADDAAAKLSTVVAGCAGADASLSSGADAAVRALLAAAPLGADGPPPPDRAVAWMGIVRAVDTELERTLLSRAKTPACRVQASQFPREATRKAPIKRDLLLQLECAFPGFPGHRLGDVAKAVADGKLPTRLAPTDAAALLVVGGRQFRYGGRDWRRAMDLAPLTDADIEELIQDLVDHAQVRKSLEGGQEVDAAGATRFERASIAILGRLGRLG